MGVVLFRKGETHTVNGIKCEFKIFDEYLFSSNLEAGWFLTPEECYADCQDEINNTPSENSTSLNSDIRNMPIGELREMVKKIDPTIDRRAHRTRLIRILSNDNQG